MYAVEFRAKIKDGIIEIPKEYINKLKDNVKVIILSEEEHEISVDIIDSLINSPIKIKNFKPLLREEIYDRNK